MSGLYLIICSQYEIIGCRVCRYVKIGFYDKNRPPQMQRKVQVGKDQEKAQSKKDSHSKNRGGKKTKLTIRYLYHETYRKPNEQLFSQ